MRSNQKFDIDALLNVKWKWDNKEMILKLLEHSEQIRFAIFCANQVIHLMPTEHMEVCLKAIGCAELYLKGKASKEECIVAANAADAAYAADAAAADAAAATYAADAAYTAAYAASAAADKHVIKAEQMEYLRSLILSKMPQDSITDWLLMAFV